MKSETINILGEIFVKQWNKSLILSVIFSVTCVLVWSSESFAQNQKNSKKSVAPKKTNSNKNAKTSSSNKSEVKPAPKQTVKPSVTSQASEGGVEESVIDEVADVEVPLKDENAAVTQDPPPDQGSLVKDVQPQMVKMSKDKKFKINFEDELITGAQDKPELETIFSRKKMNFKKMIRLRENFINESEKGKEFFREGI